MHVCLNARPVVGFKFVPFGENGHGKRSEIAVPSAKNSGLDKTWYCTPLPTFSKMFLMASAVRTGSVDFSTTILSVVATAAICRAQLSTNFRSGAIPLPLP